LSLKSRTAAAVLAVVLFGGLAGCSASPPAPAGSESGAPTTEETAAPTAGDLCDAAYLDIWEQAGAEVEVISIDKFPLDGLAPEFVAESCLIDFKGGGVGAYMGVFVEDGGATEAAIRAALVANGYSPEPDVPDRYIRGTDPQVVVTAGSADAADTIGEIYGDYVLVSVELGVL